MKRVRILAALSVPLLASAVRARDGVPSSLKGPAVEKLQALEALPPQEAGVRMDGGLRREGPVTILAENPGWTRSVYHRASTYEECETISTISNHRKIGDRKVCHTRRIPAYWTTERGTWQRVRIDDRSGYVRGQTVKGSLWGLLAGAAIAAGIIGLSGPVGIAAGLGIGAVLIGAAIGARQAKSEDTVFERVIRKAWWS